jgi:hypothetical protein
MTKKPAGTHPNRYCFRSLPSRQTITVRKAALDSASAYEKKNKKKGKLSSSTLTKVTPVLQRPRSNTVSPESNIVFPVVPTNNSSKAATMSSNYDKLKRKYQAVQEENKKLKSEIEFSQDVIAGLKSDNANRSGKSGKKGRGRAKKMQQSDIVTKVVKNVKEHICRVLLFVNKKADVDNVATMVMKNINYNVGSTEDFVTAYGDTIVSTIGTHRGYLATQGKKQAQRT